MPPGPIADAEAAAGGDSTQELIDFRRKQAGEARDKISTDDSDRSFITRIVMQIYLGVIGAGFLLFAIRGWHVGSDAEAWGGIVRDAGDLIKTAVLPIVTLVLGYYFGKSGKS